LTNRDLVYSCSGNLSAKPEYQESLRNMPQFTLQEMECIKISEQNENASIHSKNRIKRYTQAKFSSAVLKSIRQDSIQLKILTHWNDYENLLPF